MKQTGWIKIEKGGKMPKQGQWVDIWTERGRMADYRLNKNYAGKRGNNFFSPINGGVACVRYDGSDGYCQATHWMYPVPAPKD